MVALIPLPASARQLRHIALLVISGLMNSIHKSTMFENPSAATRSAAPSVAPALCMPSAIRICCWYGLRRRFPPSNSDSSSDMLPRKNPGCSHSTPTRSGLKHPRRNPRLFCHAAKSKSPMFIALFNLPVPPDSTNSAIRSCLNRNVRAVPLNSPSSVPVVRAPSFTKTASTVCLLPVPRGSRRGETCLPV
jgi:hypothetical protein